MTVVCRGVINDHLNVRSLHVLRNLSVGPGGLREIDDETRGRGSPEGPGSPPPVTLGVRRRGERSFEGRVWVD